MKDKHYDINYLQNTRKLLEDLKKRSYNFFNEINSGTIIDLGCGADRRARSLCRVTLLYRYCRRKAFDGIDVGLLHALEKLARIRGQRAHVAALAFSVDRIEGERRLA